MSKQSDSIRAWMLANNIRLSQISEETGIKLSNLSNAVNGTRKFSASMANALSKQYGMNIKHLIFGEGELFAPQTASGNSAPVIQQQGQNCTGSITTETAKDRIIEQLTESNRELVANNTRLCDMMARALDKLSDHLAGPAEPKTAK